MKKKTIDHTELLVLTLLAGEDMYGYQIITELARRSDHTFDMKEGTLYPVLHGLWKDGQVEAYEAEAPTGRKRKYYHLTKKRPGGAEGGDGGVEELRPRSERRPLRLSGTGVRLWNGKNFAAG